MENDYIVFGQPFIDNNAIMEVNDSLQSGWIGTGPKVKQFANDFANYTNARYALPVSSCTSALHLSLLASGIGPGDEVLTTPMTFCATVNSIIHAGAEPVMVDVNNDTGLIDTTLLENNISSKTRAIIPVHLWGQVCNLDKLNSIAKKYNLIIIEDAAHAIESYYKGRKIGSISDFTCFSFYANKNITTGEGGMITTNNSHFAEKIASLSSHGLSRDAWKRFGDEGYKHYEVIYPGYKYNMTDIQASLGIHQLKNINIWQKRRKEIWKYYSDELANLPIKLPDDSSDYYDHARHLFTLRINENKCKINRDNFMQKLHEKGIGTGVHYISIHLHAYYKEKYNLKYNQFINAALISQETVSLPLSAKLKDSDVDKIISSIKTIIN